MPPTESSLLSTFLLPPAPLPQILSLEKFTSLFPKAHRQNPQIKFLYRELQHARALDIDEVKRNIAREVKKGEGQQREVARVRRESERGGVAREDGENGGDEDRDDRTFLGGSKKVSTILPHLQFAVETLSSQISAQDLELQSLLQEIETKVGDLSDLRYGRFARPVGGTGTDEEGGEAGLREEVLEGLRRLEGVVKDIVVSRTGSGEDGAREGG